MRRALAFSLAFLAASVATLGPKFRDFGHAERADVDRLHRDLAGMLQERGYTARIGRSQSILRYVVAERGGCRLAVTRVQAGGGNIAPFAQLNEVGNQVRLYHDDGWADGLPQVRLLVDSLMLRFAGSAGISYDYAPVLMFAQRGDCALEGLPWQGIRLHAVRVPRGPAGPAAQRE